MFWSKKAREPRSEERADFTEPGSEEDEDKKSLSVEKWCELQQTIMHALKPYRDAWNAVSAALRAAASPTPIAVDL
ncbi:MAG TPA: hypothetical protein VMZ52_02300 [Bryobacteraceae bacterium]|nr:hypothetical protein [Bryobacteraceae bacterium]